MVASELEEIVIGDTIPATELGRNSIPGQGSVAIAPSRLEVHSPVVSDGGTPTWPTRAIANFDPKNPKLHFNAQAEMAVGRIPFGEYGNRAALPGTSRPGRARVTYVDDPKEIAIEFSPLEENARPKDDKPTSLVQRVRNTILKLRRRVFGKSAYRLAA